MRKAWLVAIALGPLACAAGTDGGPAPPPGDAVDGGAKPDVSTPQGDAYSFGGDTGKGEDSTAPSQDGASTGDGSDAADALGTTDSGPLSSDAGPLKGPDAAPEDAGPGPDTGAGTDASPPADSGPVVTGSCMAPIDVSAGGTWTIDTCSLTTTVAASCGTTAIAAILKGDAPMTGSSYSITFPSGWVIVQLYSDCSPWLYDCGSTGTWGTSGATPGDTWYWGVEPASGTCGSATVTVDRLM